MMSALTALTRRRLAPISDMPESFHIKLTGNTLPGFSPEQAARGLASVMRIDEPQARDLLSARQTIVKRNVSPDQVPLYLQAIERVGVEALAESAERLSDPAKLRLPSTYPPVAQPASSATSTSATASETNERSQRPVVPFPRAIAGRAVKETVDSADQPQQRTAAPWSLSASPLSLSSPASLSGLALEPSDRVAVPALADGSGPVSAAPWLDPLVEPTSLSLPPLPAAASKLDLVDDSGQFSETMECPACGTRQAKRTLCRECGADMPRLSASRREARYQPGENAVYAPPRASVRDSVAAAGETPRAIGFSLHGRIGRVRWLAYSLSAYLPLFVSVIVGAALAGLGLAAGPLNAALTIGGALLTIFLSIRLLVLRLHDVNRSGWWCLLWFAGGGVAPFVRRPTMLLLVFALLVLASLALALWPGSRQGNTYGLPPGENTIWTILGAVLMVGLSLIGMTTSPPGKFGAGGFERESGGERTGR